MQAQLIAKDVEYGLLPFRFIRMEDGSDRNILLTAETGEYLFVSESNLHALVRKQLNFRSALYKDLLARHFIYEPAGHNPVPEIAAQYRSRKSFIFDGPALHIFVVTLRCNHTCQYCQVSRAPLSGSGHDLSAEDAEHAINRVFESPSPTLTIEFQGEPLLAFDRIQQIVESVTHRNASERRSIQFVITTTLHHLTEEILDFAQEHQIQFSTSLDGPAFLHNSNRPSPGKDSYERTIDGIRRLRARLGHDAVSALTTLTAKSLQHPVEIIDEYVAQGFKSISLRPLSPYGFAKTSAKRLDYTMGDFIAFYKKAMAYLISLNADGIFLAEGYMSLLLASVLTPSDRAMSISGRHWAQASGPSSTTTMATCTPPTSLECF